MNRDKIVPYIEKGLVSEQAHELDSNVCIYNYTKECQYSRAWDEVTEKCRGLILNVATGEVLANPFPKFFNYGEREIDLPNEVPIITEKFDGSLGIMYWINGVPRIATRGSFKSDQAMWATEWLWRNIDLTTLNDDYTYLFEIIYPENRIVCSYDFSGLVLLAIRHRRTGTEFIKEGFMAMTPFLKRTDLAYGGGEGDFMRVRSQIHTTDIKVLKDLETKNAEGFVVYYPGAALRMKVKFDDYMRLHRIMTGLSVKGIWESLRDKKPLDAMIENVPDEFYKWFKGVKDNLEFRAQAIVNSAAYGVQKAQDLPTRKEAAQMIMRDFKDVSGVVFALLDEKDPMPIVWRMVKPTAGDKTFKIEI